MTERQQVVRIRVPQGGPPMQQAFALSEAVYRERVFRNTWGHLAPEPITIYEGSILFAFSECGDITPIKTIFTAPNGEELPGSPWFYEGMNEFIGEMCCERNETGRIKKGNVYRFIGTYRLQRNGKHRFIGKVKKIHIS